jgi:hypothetical protein
VSLVESRFWRIDSEKVPVYVFLCNSHVTALSITKSINFNTIRFILLPAYVSNSEKYPPTDQIIVSCMTTVVNV